MVTRLITFCMILLLSFTSHAQQYFTKNGYVSFFSKAPLENIKADNNQVISVIDLANGMVQFSLLNNAFHFPKAKMEEHFNEDYIESVKYPKSTFKGTIADVNSIKVAENGTYNTTVTGVLTIHGVSKNVIAPATFIVTDGKISGRSKFVILLSDYNISIPAVVKNNISNNMEITISCNYSKR